MERKIRVGAVSYLNTKPLLYGIEHSPVKNEISLITEYPSRIADMLLNDEIDIGLVPVSIIPQLKEYHINTNYCIGCDGPVASVCLFSDVPVQEIEKVLLDYQSRTSVALVKILFKKLWKKSPLFEDAPVNFLENIHGTTGAVVIGDRALEKKKEFLFSYDLGEAWKEMTGLSFVFAAWISNKQLDSGWTERFNQANEYGLTHINQVVDTLPPSDINLKDYFSKNLNYNLTDEKKKGLALFLNFLSDQ